MSDTLLDIKNISVDILVISLIVFVLTMIIKIPIKKKTSKLDENKRQAVNTLIVLIPVVLSYILTTLYHGILKSEWFSLEVAKAAISSYIITFSLYAIFQRTVIVIKGLLSGKIKIDDKVLYETIQSIKSEINLLQSNLKKDKKNLRIISNKKNNLVESKEKFEKAKDTNNLTKLSKINIEINSLTSAENKLKQEIDNAEKKIIICEGEIKNKMQATL